MVQCLRDSSKLCAARGIVADVRIRVPEQKRRAWLVYVENRIDYGDSGAINREFFQ